MPRVYDVLYTRKQDNPNNRGNKMSIERKEFLADLMQIRDVNELRLIRSAINDRIKEISSRVKYELKKGDTIIVTSKKGVEDGIIEKVNRTRAVVRMNGSSWNVPFSMIAKS